MKKLFTLLLALGTMSAVFAQYNNDNRNGRNGKDENNYGYESGKGNGGYAVPERNTDKRDYAYNDDRRYKESIHARNRERDFQLERINREYNFKINAVAGNRYMRIGEKNRQIRYLENQRSYEIKSIYARYNDNRYVPGDAHPNRW